MTRGSRRKKTAVQPPKRKKARIKRFVRRFRSGLGLEILNVAGAIVAFILTEDMRLPMVLIDKWTPLMVLLMLLCWSLDTGLMRYRYGFEADELEKEKEE